MTTMHIRLGYELNDKIGQFCEENKDIFENKSQFIRSAVRYFMLNKHASIDHYITKILQNTGSLYNSRLDLMLDALMLLDQKHENRGKKNGLLQPEKKSQRNN